MPPLPRPEPPYPAPPPLERFFGGDARAGSEMGAESRTGSSGMSGSWLKLMPSKAAGPGQAAQLFGVVASIEAMLAQVNEFQR